MKHRIAAFCALFAIFPFLLSFSATKTYAASAILDLKSFGDTVTRTEQSNTVNKEFYDTNTYGNMVIIPTCMILPFCSNNPQSSFYSGKSALAGLNNYIMAMYANPVADPVAFFRDMGQSLGFIPKQAYAQGVGFSGLAPLLGLWKAFRNIAYTLLAIVMIVIGFMVMFRKKIDPKTVVTVQNALPRVVVTLLLITFSYAIVGLLIDVMYLVILIALAIIGSSGVQGINTAQLQTNYVSGGLGQLINAVFSPLSAFGGGAGASAVGVGVGLGTAVGAFFTIFTGPIGPVIGALVAAIGYGVGAAGSLLSGQSVGLALISPLLAFVFAIGLLFAVIRIFLMLLGAYMQIILAVILGPIQILLDAVPGANGFNAWLINLVSNLMVFPITIILLAIAGVISQNIGTTSLWEPPLLPGGSAEIIRAIIGIGIVMQIPTIVNGLKKAMKVQAPISVGVGGAFAPVIGGVQMIGGHIIQGKMLERSMQHQEEIRERNAKAAAAKAAAGGGH